ncbi:MtN3 and saliva related transmembrane protein [Neorhizobium huautlense]|uniref:MtN3 and saliva related transmembrane protein n=1 Tax=Neorhizobium huautlense TaxID=67774 RepID=A0ABT9Q320_9HYPH|nr:PQ-loop domain-containing transporter [Neorhizobium huautlense]MDP9840484.1 MtN3 and saliva related transmembrane protein [Neorhizobium huautlense]
MDTTLLVGYGASICSVTSFVPQVWKVIRTGDTAAISARMYALTVVGFALWRAFGILRTEWPIILKIRFVSVSQVISSSGKSAQICNASCASRKITGTK